MLYLIKGGGKDLLAEGLVVLEAFERFLGSTLMGLPLAVTHGITGIDAAQDNRRAEDGILVGVGEGVNKFKLDGDTILLGPLDESRLEILLGLDEVVEVEMLFNEAVDNELAAAIIALVEIKGAHQGLKGIAADVAVVGR